RLAPFGPTLGWVEEPFPELLAKRLDRPVSAGNDANLGVLAEHVRGVAVGHADVAYPSGSVGIGGGFSGGGRPLTGSRGYAGEIGHLQVDSAGPTCRCGNTGCWEMKIGENQILQLAGRLPGGGPQGVAEVIEAAQHGDARSLAAVEEAADWSGIGLRAVINLFNPEMIVLGGCLAQIWDAAQDKVDEALG